MLFALFKNYLLTSISLLDISKKKKKSVKISDIRRCFLIKSLHLDFFFLRESCVICNSTVSLDVVVQALKLLPHSFTAGVMSP